MYLLVVFLPLIGSIVAGFFGRFIGRQGAAYITTGNLFLTAMLSSFIFYDVGLSGSPSYVTVMPWISSGMLHTNWGFMFDSLTAVMLIVVTYVSALVHLFSIGYMSEDPHLPRFMSYLSLFTFFMLILVTGDNFIQLFVGWEGVGLCSYLLISFWHTRIQANKAAMKAIIVNRIGDLGLTLGIVAIFTVFKSINFTTVFAAAPYIAGNTMYFLGTEFDALTVICLLLFVGAVGKSAQVGLHTWLPDAMEGPTPVSALIHAATMVTAGVFLIIKCSPIFEYAPTALLVVTFAGAITAFFAATTGLVQNDLKKVIAYSTCSQLGYMVFACGISSYSVSLFHLMNHAFFKALLFLGAGCVIHAMADEQDMRRMGGLIQIIPFTYVMMLIGSLSLMGFPFLTGFYSKDVILEVAFAQYSLSGHFAHWLGTISAFFTAFYSFRLLYLTFISNTNAFKPIIEHAHDAPVIMAIPLVVLAFGSIFVGYLTRDMMIGLGTDFFGSAIFTLPSNLALIDSEFIPPFIKLIPVIFSISGAIAAFIIYHMYSALLYKYQQTVVGRKLYTFLSRKWYFDNVYNAYVNKPLLHFGYETSFKLIDRGVVEVFGPLGISRLGSKIIAKSSQLQTGYLYNYVFVMAIGLVLFIAVVGLWNLVFYWVDAEFYLVILLTTIYSSYFSLYK